MKNTVDVIFLRKFFEFIEIQRQETVGNSIPFDAGMLSIEQIDQVDSLYADYSVYVVDDPLSIEEKGEVPIFYYFLKVEDMSKYDQLLIELGVEKQVKFNLLSPRYLIGPDIVFDTQKARIIKSKQSVDIRKNSRAYVFLLAIIQKAPNSISRDELHLLLGGDQSDKNKSDRIGTARQYLLEKFSKIGISKEEFNEIVTYEGGDYRISTPVDIEK